MKTRDMKGNEIKVGQTIKKFSLIKDESSSFKIAKVSHIGLMHEGGDAMIWAGGGGAHHPLACLVMDDI